MTETFIKYFAIIICGFYSYIKILDLQDLFPSRHKRIYSVAIFMILLAALIILTVLLRFTAPAISIIAMVALSVPLFGGVSSGTVKRSAVCTIIAYGASYTTLAIAASITAIVEFSFVELLHRNFINFIRMGMVSTLQIIVTLIVFKMKRIRHGLVFLVDTGSTDLGIYISASILVISSLLGMNQDDHLAYTVLTCIFLLSGITLWFWWKDRTTTVYLKELHLREIQKLKKELEKKEQYIERLRQENEKLASIIHRDNKQLPAIRTYIYNFFLKAIHSSHKIDYIGETEQLLKNLENIFRDRQAAIKEYEKQNSQTASTGSPPIDLTLNYMAERAADAGIDFHASILKDFSKFLRERISEKDLNTLLADLLENAIIATTLSSKRRILLNIDMNAIEIYDSGIAFPIEVMTSFGLRRITGHAGNGGSGIGLENTYKLCQKYHASFVIEEYNNEDYYSKRVAVCFDDLAQYRVKLKEQNQAAKSSISVNPKVIF